ncbi:hypothetical protein BC629DRAFT_1582977 [Irpex lacteus]|nr:hypothetical protein BC629DRAFT_1582977 [Irpex lacteus]
MSSELHPSASLYTRQVLRLYDIVVLCFSNTFAWRCSTRSILLPFFQQHLAGLESGVELVAHDAFNLAPEGIQNTPFEAVSLFYLFHCLPGTISDKARKVFGNLTPLMESNGTVYGATILGKGVQHNWIGRALVKLWNSKGVFDNYEDDVEGLTSALKEHFEDVKVRVEGMVALFVGRGPKRSGSASSTM